MRHTARDHFLHVVLPAFRDFASYYSNREMGLRRDTKNAAAIAGALRDLPEHVFYDLNGNTGYATNRSYRESFWPQSRAYQVICNFADVWKHRSISRPDRLLSCVDDIIEYYALIRYADEEGVYYGSRKLLVATLFDKSEQDLGPLLLASLTLLAAELVRQGLLPNIPDFPRLPSYFQSRTEAASALPMRIVCYVKEYIEVPQRCLIFDENTGVPRPIKPGEGFDFQYGLVMEVQPSPIQS